MTRRIASQLLLLITVVLLGGFAAAALVRYSPGFDAIPEDLNPDISSATLRALHEEHTRQNSLPKFYLSYLRGALAGDLGESESLRQPVTALVRRRAPTTARLVLFGSAAAWLAAALLSFAAVSARSNTLNVAAISFAGLLLAIPPAVLGLAFFFLEAPLALALALALLPRLFGSLRTIFEDCWTSGPLLAARARGVGTRAIALRYVLGAAAPRLVALAGVTLVLAFGLVIPIEALCGVPGLGDLALRAATARDMPLLCGLALIITFCVALVQVLGDALVRRSDAV